MMPLHAARENLPRSSRPLVWITLAYAAGIWCAARFDAWDWRWPLAAAAVLLALSLPGKGRPRACLWLAWFMVAWGATAARWDAAGGEQLGRLLQRARESVELQGRIANAPVFHPNPRRPPEGASPMGLWQFELAADRIRRLPEWQKTGGLVRVFLPGRADLQLENGSEWIVAGVLSDNLRRRLERRDWQWHWRLRDGEFHADTPAWRQSRAPAALRILHRFTMRADPAAARLIAPAGAWHPGARLQAWRARAGESLRRGLDGFPDAAAILRALILGYDDELPEDLRRRFVATGTYHLFAVSGTHMAMLAMLTAGILRLAGVSRVYWFLAVAPVLAVFTAMVGAPASAVRGSLMAGLWLLGLLVGRRNDGASALALAGLLILLYSPGQLFAPGFILSFATVAGLLCAAPFLVRKLAGKPPAPIDPARERGRAWIRKTWRTCQFCAAASAAAWLASMPLMACWFNVWSPLTALANVPVIPLAGMALGLGFLAILLGGIHPWLAAAFNWLNLAPVILMRDWLAFVQSIPGCQLTVKSPPFWTICCWYVGLGLLVWLRKNQVAGARCAVAAAPQSPVPGLTPATGQARHPGPCHRWRAWRLGAALALVLAWPAWDLLDGRGGRVQVLNAGGTAVALGRGPGLLRKAAWLVNAGSRRYTRRLKQMLALAGVNRLDIWMLPGMDADRVSAAEILMASGEFNAERAVYPFGFNRYHVFTAMRGSLEVAGTELTETRQPASDILPGGLVWRTWPIADTPGRMKAEIAAPVWNVTIIPPGAAGHLRDMVEIDIRDHARKDVAARLIIDCLPCRFDAQCLPDGAGSCLGLAPGEILTLDFAGRGMQARWP